MAKLVAMNYGKALFELAVEKHTLDSMLEEVEAVLQVFQANKEFIRLMNHPEILLEEKEGLLEETFRGRVSDELTGFLMAIGRKSRFVQVEEILDDFIGRVREYKKIGVAQVTSAVPLSDQEKREVQVRLLDTTSYESFCMEFYTDPALIGGMIIKIDDRVVDGSIKTKLASMAKELSNIQLSI